MKRTTYYSIYLWMAFVWLLFSPGLSIGQKIVTSGDILKEADPMNPASLLTGTFIKSPGGGALTTVALDFNLVGGTEGGWTVSNVVVNGAGSAIVINDAATGAATLTLTSTLPSPSGLATIQFTVGANGGTFERDVLVKIRKQLDIVLVLDRSGSMECAPDRYDWTACITSAAQFGTDSRWAKLKTAVHNLTDKLVQTSLAGDRISLTLFDGEIKTTASAGVDPAVLTGFLDLKSAGLTGKVDAILADQVQPLGRNGTAIGKGLKNAVHTKFTPPDAERRRVIMLFTDGEQNVIPFVREAGAGAGKFVEEATPLPLNNGSSPDTIEKFSVGLGSSTIPYAQLLRDISSDPASNTSFTTTGQDGLFATLISDDFFNAIYSGFSPETIVETQQNIGAGFTERVVCNSTAERLFLQVYLENDIIRYNQFLVFHAGQNVTDFAQISRTMSSVLFTFDSRRLANAGIGMAGSWELRSTRLPGVAAGSNGRYLFSATADDNSFHMKCEPGASDWKVNDIVKPAVKLTYNGKPLLGAKVTALLIGPADDVADVIARDTVKSFDPSQDPDAGKLFTQKLGKLMTANPAYLEKFIDKNPTNRIVLSSADSNGNYSGAFGKALDMTGIHHLVYFVEYIQGNDTIIRRERQPLVVRFGDIDLGNSAVTFTAGTAGAVSTLMITPVDSRGKRIGLGYGSLFRLESPGAKITGVKENPDGSYVISIDGPLEGDATITVMGVEVYKGSLQHLKCYGPGASFLTKLRCWLQDKGIPEWLFWLVLALLLLFIIWLFRKKK